MKFYDDANATSDIYNICIAHAHFISFEIYG